MKNIREIYEALLRGETLVHDDGEDVFLGKDDIISNRVFAFSYPEDWHIKKPEQKPLGRLYISELKILKVIHGNDFSKDKWKPVTISENGEVWTVEK